MARPKTVKIQKQKENPTGNPTENPTGNPTENPTENMMEQITQQNNDGLDIEPKAPRKRGRPKGSQNKDVSNDTITNAPKDTKKPHKKRTTKKKEITTESLKMSIMGTHAVLAIYTPSAMISEPNATAMALAMKQVIEEYDMTWIAHYFPIVALAGTIAFCEMPTVKALKAEHERRVNIKKSGGNPTQPTNFKNVPHMVPIREDMNND